MYSETAYFMRKSLIIKTSTSLYTSIYGNCKKKLSEHSPKLKLTSDIEMIECEITTKNYFPRVKLYLYRAYPMFLFA